MAANEVLNRHSAGRLAGRLWRRAVWMRLGALSGLLALSILLSADQPLFRPGLSAAIRLAAQVQFMHGMATLACATFMNIGAKGARLAPAFFLGGILLHCFPVYAAALGLFDVAMWIGKVGLAAFAAGWLILAWSARDIDRD